MFPANKYHVVYHVICPVIHPVSALQCPCIHLYWAYINARNFVPPDRRRRRRRRRRRPLPPAPFIPPLRLFFTLENGVYLHRKYLKCSLYSSL